MDYYNHQLICYVLLNIYTRTKKKTELYTGTKSYLDDRNKLMNGFNKQINDAYKNVMDGELKTQNVPMAERQRIAMKVQEILKMYCFKH